MTWIMLLPMLFDLFPKIMKSARTAEKLYTGIKEGRIKKQYVMDFIRDTFDIRDYFDSDLDKNMGIVMNIADKGIDFLVSVLNMTGRFQTTSRIDTRPKDE